MKVLNVPLSFCTNPVADWFSLQTGVLHGLHFEKHRRERQTQNRVCICAKWEKGRQKRKMLEK